PDIRQRIEKYVREMAQPKITGIGKGEELTVVWPGAEWDRVNIVPMIAFLQREAMVSALLREVDRLANEPMPPAARRQRISELEAQLELLQRQSLALGAEPSDLPPQVVLGCKLATRQKIERHRSAA